MLLPGMVAEVMAYVPRCAEQVDYRIYVYALHSKTVEEAYKWLQFIEDRLPIPLVKPWEVDKDSQQKVLVAMSQYSTGHTHPTDLGHRETEPSRDVMEFSEAPRKPKRIRVRRKGPRRLPPKYVCPYCGRDTRHAGTHRDCEVE